MRGSGSLHSKPSPGQWQAHVTAEDQACAVSALLSLRLCAGLGFYPSVLHYLPNTTSQTITY